MKVLFSELKTFLPKLKAGPKEVADAFTYTGLMVDQYKEVKFRGVKDVLLGLEVRQNRPDCLGVIGLAREIATYFKTPLVLPKLNLPKAKQQVDFQVKATGLVKRASAIQLSGLDNSKATPKWLVEALGLHGINSISLLVDISNYAMLMTGYPNHLFDADKVVGKLVWQKIPKEENFSTLDGTVLELSKNDELVISDNLGPLVIASAIGGRRSALSARTSSVIAEVAVYDQKKVREDVRKHKLSTEASSRLEKQLAPEHVVWALEYLASLLIEHGGGNITLGTKDYYPKVDAGKKKIIAWPLAKAKEVGGVEVTMSFAKDVLTRLGFEPREQKQTLLVKVPEWRADIDSVADITEEVLRMYGFQNIKPVKPVLEPVSIVTPDNLVLSSKVKSTLSNLGMDEVLTLPLTTTSQNDSCGGKPLLTEIRTQNAINEEYPVLRTNLLAGLLYQQEEYLKKGVESIQVFELGKVFWRTPKKYCEAENVGLLLQSADDKTALNKLYVVLEGLLRQLGAVAVTYEQSELSPDVLEKGKVWQICVHGLPIGFLGVLKARPLSGNKLIKSTVSAELRLDDLMLSLEKEKTRGAAELMEKMAVLDANFTLNNREELNQAFLSIRKKYHKNIWSLAVIDQFNLPEGGVRYTLRATYFGLAEKEAKKLHHKIFSL